MRTRATVAQEAGKLLEVVAHAETGVGRPVS